MNRSILLSIAVLIIISLIIGLWVILYPQSLSTKQGFGIYLAENDKLIISDKEIISYNDLSYELELTDEGVDRIKALDVPMSGKPFAAKLGEKTIYEGSFWVPWSSQSYSGIVINILSIQNNNIKLEQGYPSSSFFEGADLRDNSELSNHFRSLQKLR